MIQLNHVKYKHSPVCKYLNPNRLNNPRKPSIQFFLNRFFITISYIFWKREIQLKNEWWDVLDSMELKTPLTIILRLSS